MKNVVKKLVRGEQGAALILVLVVLLVGGLIAGGLLQHMGAGLLSGEVYATRTAELYAADAGVEDAVWKIQHGETPLCAANRNWTYPSPSEPPMIVNGKSVQVTIEYQDDGSFKISSTAASIDDTNTAAILSSTGVEAYISPSFMDFASLLDNAIVSNTSIIIHNNVSVTGNVTSGGTVTTPGGDPEDVDGTVTQGADLDWPKADDLSAYYLDDVDDVEPPFPYSHPLNIGGADLTLEALYREGDWTIYNDSNTAGTITLSGTVYVKGDLEIGVTNKDLTLNLNNQTIFVESASADPQKAIEIGDRCTIIGSGCIIAVGDVYFAPKGTVGGEHEFVLVMSVAGTTTLRPSGTFYGCVAGDLAVDVQSGTSATIINTGLSEAGDLNFPMGIGDDPNELPPVSGVKIESWEVSQQ